MLMTTSRPVSRRHLRYSSLSLLYFFFGAFFVLLYYSRLRVIITIYLIFIVLDNIHGRVISAWE